MRYFPNLLLALLLGAGTTAVAGPPGLPPNAKELLRGTWKSTDDADSQLIITEKQYIERYKGQPDAASPLRVQPQPCGEKPSRKPSGTLYLDTSDFCYYVVSVSATRLELSEVGGRGNTLTYKRVAIKQK